MKWLCFGKRQEGARFTTQVTPTEICLSKDNLPWLTSPQAARVSVMKLENDPTEFLFASAIAPGLSRVASKLNPHDSQQLMEKFFTVLPTYLSGGNVPNLSTIQYGRTACSTHYLETGHKDRLYVCRFDFASIGGDRRAFDNPSSSIAVIVAKGPKNLQPDIMRQISLNSAKRF